MPLPCYVVPVEMPRPKAHRVEPVLLSMSVSGHSLGMSAFSQPFRPTRGAAEFGTQVTKRSRLEGMVRRVYGNGSRSLCHPGGGNRCPVPAADLEELVPGLGLGVGVIGSVRPDRRGGMSGDRPIW
jgi:hypothetical protein